VNGIGLSVPLPVEGMCNSSIQKWQLGPFLFPPFPMFVLFSPHMGDFIAVSHGTVCCYDVFFSQGWHMHKDGLGGQLGCQVKQGSRFKGNIPIYNKKIYNFKIT